MRLPSDVDSLALALPPPLAVAWASLLGAVVGSFLNVVIARVPRGESVVSPRSRCPRCAAAIAWYDNIPVFSWILLRARCRACGAPISWRYPVVEALAGGAGFLACTRHGLGGAFAAELAFVAVLLALAFIDLDTWLLPHALTWPLIAFGLATGALGFSPTPFGSSLLGAALGFAAFAAVAVVGEKVFRKEALGFGDVWLLAGIGAFLGAKALLPVVLLASLQGSVVGIALLLAGRGTPGPAPGPARPASPPASASASPPGPIPVASPAPAAAPATEVAAPAGAVPPPAAPGDWVPPRHALPFGPSWLSVRSSGSSSAKGSVGWSRRCASSGRIPRVPPRAAHVRLVLLLHAAAIAAAASALLLAAGLPLAARGALSPGAFVAAVGVAAAASFLLGAALLFRTVARPVDRLLVAAERLAGPGGLPLLGEPGGAALSQASVAFERLAGELAEERARLAAKVEELTRANRALAEARESLLRSETLATVGRLASGVAHEVGNPLGAIAGYVELARARLRDGKPGDPDDYLGRVALEVQRIDRTVRGLLDFARPSGPDLASVDLAAAVEAALRLARVQARFRDVRVTLDLPAGLPPVLADEHGLAQVLLNLFLNAGDAMGGSGAMRVSARPAEGTRVLLDVADRGPGISPEDLPRIFDPFFTTKEPGKGTGLGLAISHRIVESFGGEIAAANGPAGGAVFTVAFRRAAAAGPERGPA